MSKVDQVDSIMKPETTDMRLANDEARKCISRLVSQSNERLVFLDWLRLFKSLHESIVGFHNVMLNASVSSVPIGSSGHFFDSKISNLI
jgi:hypothetical protein